jgi:4-diphosphocytidyl-2-C-methyl-D-erythritol kinase
MSFTSFLAPAKINLYLHVGPQDQNNYHPLDSLVTFADIGDSLGFEQGLKGLSCDGPFSDGLCTGPDNLIEKARSQFEAYLGQSLGGHFHLTKNLPVASGLGGGSSDAGAALKLLRNAFRADMDNASLEAMAAKIGADGVMCLWVRSAIAKGYGETLSYMTLPLLPCVLINPMVLSPTKLVYDGFDQLGLFEPLEPRGLEGTNRFLDKNIYQYKNLEPILPSAKTKIALNSVIEVVHALNGTRNDLEASAIKINPVIAEVLGDLLRHKETLFARMSGSGATCFALCASMDEAKSLAEKLMLDWSKAWIRPCTLGGN